jgi:hypothetical protein
MGVFHPLTFQGNRIVKYKISIELCPEREHEHDFSITESGTLTIRSHENCDYSQKIAAVIVRMLREYDYEPSAYEWVLARMAGYAGEPIHEVALLYECWDCINDIRDCISIDFERAKLISDWDLEDSWCQDKDKVFAEIEERKAHREFGLKILRESRERQAAKEMSAASTGESVGEGDNHESA